MVEIEFYYALTTKLTHYKVVLHENQDLDLIATFPKPSAVALEQG
jgi:hypothetical protein